jgi:hypothetical protein
MRVEHHKDDVMILSRTRFMTDCAEKISSRFGRGLFIFSGGLAVGLVFLLAVGLVFDACALSVASVSPRAYRVTVCSLQNGTGLRPGGEQSAGGKDLAASGFSNCRMFRISVRFDSGQADSSSQSSVRRLGNAQRRSEYRLNVCDNMTGRMFFDERIPYIEKMIVQGGRHAGYGQEIGYKDIRQGMSVRPVAVGDSIRLTLNFYFGRALGKGLKNTLNAPKVNDVGISTCIDIVPGQWVEVGERFEQTVPGMPDRHDRVIGNSRRHGRMWVRVDDLPRP